MVPVASFPSLLVEVRRLHRVSPLARRVYLPLWAEHLILGEAPAALVSDVNVHGVAGVGRLDGLVVDWSDREADRIYVVQKRRRKAARQVLLQRVEVAVLDGPRHAVRGIDRLHLASRHAVLNARKVVRSVEVVRNAAVVLGGPLLR